MYPLKANFGAHRTKRRYENLRFGRGQSPRVAQHDIADRARRVRGFDWSIGIWQIDIDEYAGLSRPADDRELPA